MAKIGVDIDEVLSETVKSFLSFYNTNHDTSFEFEQIYDYSFGQLFGITPDEEVRSIKEFFASDYFLKLQPISGSQEAITELSKNNQLYAVTSRPDQLAEPTKLWLDEHFAGCFKEIILTNSHFDKTRTKSDICQSKSLDIFIEDQIVFAEDCARVCSTVFMFDKPWSHGKIDSDNVVRVKSWPDLLAKLKARP